MEDHDMASHELVTHKDGGESMQSPFFALQHDMHRMFQDFFSLPAFGMRESERLWNGGLQPKLDIAETDNAIEVTVELPGADEKDVEVVVESGMLTIKGEKQASTEEEGKTFHRVERSYGAFRRSLALPSYADEDAIKATFENGLLSVTVPKRAGGTKRGKKIEVAKGK